MTDRPDSQGDIAGRSAIIALGSNLDDPLERLRSARLELAAIGRIEAASSLYRTTPVGGPPGQPEFLNAVIVLEPSPAYRRPADLLSALLEIEKSQGRRRRVRWEARVLDLDLLALGSTVLEGSRLVLPHPRMMERPFVLAPLCEILPEWRHPLTGASPCESLEVLGSAGVERTDVAWDGGQVTR